jgi:transcriptional regulator with XRE-family HTH domain
MKPALCRAARALLGLSQRELAARAEVGLSTLVEFEISDSKPNPKGPRRSTLAAIRRVFDDAGVKFQDEDLVGVLLPKELIGVRELKTKAIVLTQKKAAAKSGSIPEKPKRPAGRSKKVT